MHTIVHITTGEPIVVNADTDSCQLLAGPSAPAPPLHQQLLQQQKHQTSLNETLIVRLFESLESLKHRDLSAHTNTNTSGVVIASGSKRQNQKPTIASTTITTTPSPQSLSCSSSASSFEPIPSTPTGQDLSSRDIFARTRTVSSSSSSSSATLLIGSGNSNNNNASNNNNKLPSAPPPTPLALSQAVSIPLLLPQHHKYTPSCTYTAANDLSHMLFLQQQQSMNENVPMFAQPQQAPCDQYNQYNMMLNTMMAMDMGATSDLASLSSPSPSPSLLTKMHHAMPQQQQQQQQQQQECLVGIGGAYQSYCHQVISDELNFSALSMLTYIRNAQINDTAAVTRLMGKRYYCSLKEVSKVVTSAKILLISPDVRPSFTSHIRPVRLLQSVMDAADAAGVPYVFCLSRRGIGQVFGRGMSKCMSIVAVMHVDGVEREYLHLLQEAARGRELFLKYRLSPSASSMPIIGNGIGVGIGVTMSAHVSRINNNTQGAASLASTPIPPPTTATSSQQIMAMHGGGFIVDETHNA